MPLPLIHAAVFPCALDSIQDAAQARRRILNNVPEQIKNSLVCTEQQPKAAPSTLVLSREIYYKSNNFKKFTGHQHKRRKGTPSPPRLLILWLKSKKRRRSFHYLSPFQASPVCSTKAGRAAKMTRAAILSHVISLSFSLF